MQHYQGKKDRYGSSITYGGGVIAGGEAACSSSEVNYNVSSSSSIANGTSSDQSASYGYYPYHGLREEKENLVHTSAGGGVSGCPVGGGWTQEAVVTGKTWGENASGLADYGFEEIKQLISIDNSPCSFLLDENRVGGNVYYY